MGDKKFLLQVVGDTNDADYITKSTEVSLEDIQEILPVVEAIKNCEADYNWPSSEYQSFSPEIVYEELVDPVLLEKFSYYCPYGEYGIHTIESICYWPIAEKVTLL